MKTGKKEFIVYFEYERGEGVGFDSIILQAENRDDAVDQILSDHVFVTSAVEV